MASNETELAKLRACKVASDAVVTQIAANKIITDEYNVRVALNDAAHATDVTNWNIEDAAAKAAYKVANDVYDIKKTKWKTDTDNANSFFTNEEFVSNCPWVHCETAETVHIRNQGCNWGPLNTGGWQAVCRRNQTKLDRDLGTWIASYNSQIGGAPTPTTLKNGTSRSYPTKLIVTQPAQNSTTTNIQCCSNYINTNNSTVDDVSQSCSQTLQQRITTAETAPVVPTPIQTTLLAPAPLAPTNEEKIVNNEKMKIEQQTNIIIGAVITIGVLLLLLIIRYFYYRTVS